MLANFKNGTLLVFLTAIVSGFSIYLNKFVVSGMNAFVFTTLKNASVALLLFAVILLFAKFKELKQLSLKDWKNLFLIGLTGGSTAFLLFFYGLSITSAVNAGFIHKTLFVFAGVFALVFLKEKIEKKMLLAGIAIFASLFLLFGLKISSFNVGDLFILLAVILWSLELVLAKKSLQNLSGTTVAFGRMFFGSLIMLAFLALSNQGGEILSLNTLQLEWVAITGFLLFLYVVTFYNGLKLLSISKATIILLAAVPITAVLSLADARPLSVLEILGNILLLAGVVIACVGISSLKRVLAWKA